MDGRESPILAANINLRAVALPQGRHMVVFRFQSAPARWGRWVSAAAFLLAFGGLGLSLVRARRAGGMVV